MSTLIDNINLARMEKLVSLTVLFGLNTKLHKHLWSATKEGLFLNFVQQFLERVGLDIVSSLSSDD
jgi:hypothetical protein